MLAVAAEPHEPLARGCSRLLFGADWVSLNDLGFQQGLQPTPRHRPQRRRKLPIHPGCLLGGEVPGGGSNPAALVGRHLTGEGGGPDQPQPMPQIQRIGDQPGRRPVGDPQYTTKLSRSEVRDSEGALTTQSDRPLRTGQPTLG